MFRFFLWLPLLPLLVLLMGYRFRTAEQYYQLYHQHLYAYPEDIVTNINYLLAARSAPFNNALYALTPISNQQEWLYYQQLFRIHVSLKLIEQQLLLASGFDKYHGYFFNKPWRDKILASLDQAETAYGIAADFWQETLTLIDALPTAAHFWVKMSRITYWQNEVWRIKQGQLDYRAIINRQLARLAAVRQALSD